MFELPAALQTRDSPVRVGVIGAGQFGSKCIDQLERVPGFATSAVADPGVERAEAAYAEAGVPRDAVDNAADADEVDEVVEAGRRAVSSDGSALAAADLDVVVEATGEPNAGARHAYEAITAGTHVVMATVEADATVGPVLADLAGSRDLVYSTAYGDQPALIAELVAWARTIGLDVVAAGRGMGSFDANAAIELCAAANATGLPPDVPGIRAPTVTLADIPDRLRPDEAGGVLSEAGIVEGTVSPSDESRTPGQTIADGVFVVVTTPNDDAMAFLRAKNELGAYASSDGDYLVFFRGHHLPGSETPVSVARAAVIGSHTGTPRHHVADITAVADEPLRAGTTVEIAYPETDVPLSADLVRTDETTSDRVPFTLLDGAEIVAPIDAGDPLTDDDIELEPSVLWHLRGLMDPDRCESYASRPPSAHRRRDDSGRRRRHLSLA